jgi:hypothetical protein
LTFQWNLDINGFNSYESTGYKLKGVEMMAFERQKFDLFTELLKSNAKGSDIEMRCNAENFLLEERLTEAREDNYEEFLKYPVDKDSWYNVHKNYVYQKIYIKLETPETFADINNPNLISIDVDQYLVRLENVSELSRLYGGTLDQMMKQLQDFAKNPKKPENQNITKDFFYKWNRKRDRRPLFSGFWGEVKDIFTDEHGNPIENKDWANQLRDRFGLGHLDPGNDEPIPVLVFRYQVKDVFPFNPDNPKVIAIPTVLDSRLSSFFCSTPKKGWNEGQALDLSSGDENDYRINSEILHMGIEYNPEFLYNAGWITKSPGKTLEQARKIHLDLLIDSFKNKLQVMSDE